MFTPFVRESLLPLLGEGLLLGSGDRWSRHGQVVRAAFAAADGKRFAGAARAGAERVAERWERAAAERRSVDLLAEMGRLNTDVVSRALFGAEGAVVAEKLERPLGAALEYVMGDVLAFERPPYRLRPSFRGFRAQRRQVDEILYAEVAARRREPRDDVVSELIRPRDGGGGLSDDEVRDEIVTTYFGANNAVRALTWTWHALSLHPRAARRVREETIAAGDDSAAAALAGAYAYTTAVAHEVLRLTPPLWAISRSALEDDELADYRIPAGTTMVISPFITHRHASFWSNPEGFDPSRFDGSGPAPRHPYAFFPFGGGPLRCAGEHLAILQLQVVVGALAPRFDVQLAPGHRIVRTREPFLRPVNGMRATVRRVAA